MGVMGGFAKAESKAASKGAAKTTTKTASKSAAKSEASSFSSTMNKAKEYKETYDEVSGYANQAKEWAKEFQEGQKESVHVDENISKNLAKEQAHEQEELARIQKELNQRNSNPAAQADFSQSTNTSSSSSSSSSYDSAKAEQMAKDAKEKSAENQRQQEERKAQVAEQTAELERKKEEEIAKVESWRDEKIEKIKAGPTGIVKFYTSKTALLISTAVDSGFAFIPVAGDFFGFFFNLAFWIIPFILSGQFSAYLKVVGFYVVDLIVGLVGGTLANVLPSVGDALVDLVPEVVVMTAMQSNAPYNVLEKSYTDRIPHMINDIDNRAKKKIAAIRKSTSSKELALKKTLSGKRNLVANISLDGQKMITFVFSMLILVMGPVGTFLPVRLPIISFDSGSLVIVGITSAFILIFAAFSFINKKRERVKSNFGYNKEQ